MVLSLILYGIALVALVATHAIGLRDGAEYRSGIRSTIAALLCIAFMWASWQIMYSVAQDNPACETSTEVTD